MLLSSSHTRVRPAHESLLVSFLSSRKAHQAFLLVEADSRAPRKPGNLHKLDGFLCCSHRGPLTAPHTVGPLGTGLFKESGNATCRCSLRMNVCMCAWCVCMWTHMPQCMHGSQRTSVWSRFSSSAFTWVPGTKLDCQDWRPGLLPTEPSCLPRSIFLKYQLLVEATDTELRAVEGQLCPQIQASMT